MHLHYIYDGFSGRVTTCGGLRNNGIKCPTFIGLLIFSFNVLVRRGSSRYNRGIVWGYAIALT